MVPNHPIRLFFLFLLFCGLSTLQNLNFHNRKRIQIQTSVWLFFPPFVAVPLLSGELFSTTQHVTDNTQQVSFSSHFILFLLLVSCVSSFLFLLCFLCLFLLLFSFFSSFPFFFESVAAKVGHGQKAGRGQKRKNLRPKSVAARVGRAPFFPNRCHHSPLPR